MIADIEIYVIGKGYTEPKDLNIGDRVFVLEEQDIRVSKISEVRTETFVGELNRIKSGQFQALATDSTRFLHRSERHGYDLLEWKRIHPMKSFRSYSPTVMYPVLTGIYTESRSFTDSEIEGIVRKLAARQYDTAQMEYTLRHFSGLDNYVFIDLLENYISDHPGQGTGIPSGKNVKARMFKIEDYRIEREIVKCANLAGMTAEINGSGYLRISFESIPIYGSVTRAEKFFKEMYQGEVHAVNAENLPILGRSLNKYYFIPTVEAE